VVPQVLSCCREFDRLTTALDNLGGHVYIQNRMFPFALTAVAQGQSGRFEFGQLMIGQPVDADYDELL